MTDGSLVITNIGELSTNVPGEGPLTDCAVAITDGAVRWVGKSDALPKQFEATPVADVEGRAVVPGFVDAHTHTVFSGDRATEFGMRMRGASYEELLAAGGGILSTVEATRRASMVDLIGESMPRINRMLAAGTTTAEVKTGYGLDVATEVGMADTIGALDMALPIDLVSTFLGAHVVPPEFRDRRDEYVTLVAGDMLDAISDKVSFVDVFCDDAAFTVDETRTICEAAREKGLGIRLHADQLSRSGGTSLAAELRAASVDHCDHATDEDIGAVVEAGVTVVLLPGVSFSMREGYPDGRRFLDAGATVALATDCNPGTSYVETMPFIISLAVVNCGFTPAEALWSATRGGALSLGLEDRGIVEPGALGDLVVLDAPSYTHLPYRPDGGLVAATVKRGSLL